VHNITDREVALGDPREQAAGDVLEDECDVFDIGRIEILEIRPHHGLDRRHALHVQPAAPRTLWADELARDDAWQCGVPSPSLRELIGY